MRSKSATPRGHPNPKSAIVVGAGLGGLGTAVRLAGAGYGVTLVEKNEQAGGKLSIVEAQGFRFDTGPSLVTLPGVIADTFRAAGRRMEDYLSLTPLDPICRYRFADGTGMDVSSDMPRLVREVERVSPGDVAGLFRFLAYARTLFKLAGPVFLLRERPGLRDLLSRRGLDAARIDAHLSMHTAVSRFFKDGRLVQLFDRYATYTGSSPYRAPATLSMIPYLEIAQGGWYIQGGIYQLAESLLSVAKELGVDFRPRCEATQILFEGEGKRGRAAGVKLASGEELRAGHVAVNADPMYAYPALVPPLFQDRRLVNRMEKLEPSCSGFALLLGVRGDYPQLAHHNVFFGGDYKSEFDAIFERGTPAPDPTIYVACTSKSDSGQAPPGYLNLFVLVNAPALPAEEKDYQQGRTRGSAPMSGTWDMWQGPYRDLVVKKLEATGLDGLGERIVFERVITPQDFKEKYNAWRGSIYGLSSNSRLTAFLRPPNRAPGVKGLYFVGGSVHPGGGIPLVLLSARLVSRLIINSGS